MPDAPAPPSPATPVMAATPADADLPVLIETPPGRYRHYKGGLYDVIGTVRHSESLEPMTLYRALYGAQGLWVRPAAMFAEDVVIAGVRQPRFARIATGDPGACAWCPSPCLPN